MSNSSPFDSIKHALQQIIPHQTQLVSPLPKYSKAQDEAISQIRKTKPGLQLSDDKLRELYGKYGDKIVPSPAQQNPVDTIKGAVGQLLGSQQTPQVLGAETIDQNKAVPSGIGLAMQYLKSQANGQDPMQYYKALQDPDFMTRIKDADKLRPGLSNLLLLQAFHESTLGNKSNNLFGALPGGEGNAGAAFASPSDALDYQLSPHVLGGGGNPNMNILKDKTPLTLAAIQKLYQSYNPEGAYLPDLIQTLGKN